MRELIENIKGTLDAWGELTEVLLNAISLICIIVGIIISLSRSIQQRKHQPGVHPMHSYFRKVFGGWLVVALEIQLAADIVGTIVSPTNAHLIELGAIAVIRTFLNYFLSKELKEEPEYGKRLLAQKPAGRVVQE
ncbi:hypothetical protein A4H97_18100 [Niastella yeongjuensis]|uniref:DUF1622 domain-containing protein n=1 Tax=Niastella yeongjuensis TaxID=354355 RepID=A0A1V9DXN7_9BACT|nr:DUF1622 domain-containing protein [Niastella yeongjuensis]OQP38636.1 hypothetical protein A4H97_18100 [Niastella yeongjuensis]SEO38623.1 Uncharacterized membrane protein [Niastella yeongjuensis]